MKIGDKVTIEGVIYTLINLIPTIGSDGKETNIEVYQIG